MGVQGDWGSRFYPNIPGCKIPKTKKYGLEKKLDDTSDLIVLKTMQEVFFLSFRLLDVCIDMNICIYLYIHILPSIIWIKKSPVAERNTNGVEQ